MSEEKSDASFLSKLRRRALPAKDSKKRVLFVRTRQIGPDVIVPISLTLDEDKRLEKLAVHYGMPKSRLVMEGLPEEPKQIKQVRRKGTK